MTSKNQINVTIAAGASASSTIGLVGASRIAAIAIPAGWTAADLGFNVGNAVDGSGNLSNGQQLFGSGGAVYAVKATAGKTILLNTSFDLMTFPYLQLVSLAAGTANPLAQVSAVVLTVYFDDAY
jgi:hypothetical protein